MPRHKHRHQRPGKWRSLFLWHRYIGLSVSLLVLLLAVTGIALNHTETLRLDEHRLNNTWLLNWYGIKALEIGQTYQINQQHITQVGHHIYIDSQIVAGAEGKLNAAIGLPNLGLLLIDNTLLLITPTGDIIDRLSADDGLPGAVQRLGASPGGPVIQVDHKTYQTNHELLEWRAFEQDTQATIQWSKPSLLPKTLAALINQQSTGEGLPLERVVLDLHSGRLFGHFGVWVMDIAALLMGLLALSGIWIWASQKLRRRKQHRLSRHRHQRHADTE